MATVPRVGRYVWDPEKERRNVRRHGILFGEAETVVESASSRTSMDARHSMTEPRFITVGWSSSGRLLVVITSEGGPRPRIIPHGAPRSANAMPTLDDDLEIPEITDFSGWEVGRYARKPGEGLDIQIDGAVGYSLRLIPSNKIVGRFASTFEAWPAVLAELDRGIPARSLVLDWHGANGERGRVTSGRLLAHIARSGIGTLDVPERLAATI